MQAVVACGVQVIELSQPESCEPSSFRLSVATGKDSVPPVSSPYKFSRCLLGLLICLLNNLSMILLIAMSN